MSNAPTSNTGGVDLGSLVAHEAGKTGVTNLAALVATIDEVAVIAVGHEARPDELAAALAR